MGGARGQRGPQEGARGQRRWGYGLRGCSSTDGADLSLLIIGCARGGRRESAGPGGCVHHKMAQASLRPAAQMRTRDRRSIDAPPQPTPHETRHWRRVLQGPGQNAWSCAGVSAGEGIKTRFEQGRESIF